MSESSNVALVNPFWEIFQRSPPLPPAISRILLLPLTYLYKSVFIELLYLRISVIRDSEESVLKYFSSPVIVSRETGLLIIFQLFQATL